MPRSAAVLLLTVLSLGGCGGGIEAGAGNFASRDRTNGPNFDTRHVDSRDALYAIRNGGFSGTIMPANIVTGRQAELMAQFLDRYSGRERGGGDVLDSGEQAR
jgi:hypothetical protein